MKLGADEKYRIRKAKERMLEGCFKTQRNHSGRMVQTSGNCVDPLCAKIKKKCAGDYKVGQNCPCNTYGLNAVMRAVNALLKEDSQR